MTPDAVLLSACSLVGIRDPIEFYALPETVQAMWREHATNLFTGAYQERPKATGPTGAEQAADAERRFMEAQARKRLTS